MAKSTKKKKKYHKEPSTIVKVAKVALPIMGGAVAGAFAVRFVDRTFGNKLPSSVAPETAPPDTVDNPMSDPRAAAAISPVVVVQQPQPYGAMHHWPGFAGNPAGPAAAAPVANPGPAAEPEPNPEEVRRKREEDFDALIDRFEQGDVSLH